MDTLTLQETHKFKATGYVVGYLWGGGTGIYKAKEIEAESKEQLLTKANEMLDNNTLDDGMGFESLKGAMLFIDDITSIVYNDKTFTHTDDQLEPEIIGKVSSIDEDFIWNRIADASY